jgi:hypothetical protein
MAYMRVFHVPVIVCALTMVSAAGFVQAGTVKLSVPFSNPSHGGPFDATVVSAIAGYSGPNTFRTFCLERGETFTPNTVYEVVLSDRAKYGTNGSSGGTDVLNSTTAYLYSHFRKGDLGTLLAAAFPGTTFSYTNTSHLYSLQDVIWKFEGESVSLSSYENKLKSLAEANANGTLYNVRVMQLWDVGKVNQFGHQHQDQLIIVPLQHSVQAALILLAGVAVVAAYRARANNIFA